MKNDIKGMASSVRGAITTSREIKGVISRSLMDDLHVPGVLAAASSPDEPYGYE